MLSYKKVENTKKDIKVLNHLVKGFVKDYAQAGDKLSTTKHTKITKNMLKGRTSNVALWFDNNQVIGYTQTNAKYHFLNIEQIYILPQHRNSGYANKIYKAIMEVPNTEFMVTLSMGRIEENIDYFRSLGFTNFIGDVVSSYKRDHGLNATNLQYGKQGLAHITTQGVFDLCIENVNMWNVLVEQMPNDNTAEKWFHTALLENMIINDTTGEDAVNKMLQEVKNDTFVVEETA